MVAEKIKAQVRGSISGDVITPAYLLILHLSLEQHCLVLSPLHCSLSSRPLLTSLHFSQVMYFDPTPQICHPQAVHWLSLDVLSFPHQQTCSHFSSLSATMSTLSISLLQLISQSVTHLFPAQRFCSLVVTSLQLSCCFCHLERVLPGPVSYLHLLASSLS